MNCLFDVLVAQYCELVCGMNLVLLEGFVDGLGCWYVVARFDLVFGCCCVVVGLLAVFLNF